jgi:hypothetical protein
VRKGRMYKTGTDREREKEQKDRKYRREAGNVNVFLCF